MKYVVSVARQYHARTPRILTGLCLLSFAACSGSIDGSLNLGNGGGQGGSTGVMTDPMNPVTPVAPDPSVTPPERMMSAACRGVDPGPSPIRRLTRFEYENTVRDLLGDNSNAAKEFPPEERRHGFDNNAAALTVSPALGEEYLNAATGLATTAVDTQMAKLLNNCDTAKETEDGCARKFFSDFGKRAYRRPPTTEEIAVLQKVYTQGKGTGGFKNGIKLSLMTMLISPRFLYRVELGLSPKAGEQVVRLDSWEMASRLSYLIWASMPDGELLAAAEAGQLTTREQIAAHAERMLKDPKAKAVVRNFNEQWLELHKLDAVEKDLKVYPKFSASNLPLLEQETLRFLDHVVWEGDGTLGAMLTAPYTFVDATLATFYGMARPAGMGLQQATLDGQKRAGLLTHGSLMTLFANANQTSPVLRGKFVREQLICQEPPPPPNDVQIELPPLDPNLTTRQRFDKHATDPACAGCHKLMDPIGLGFENLDGIGLWRDNENGKAIDASGEVVGVTNGKFSGPVELARRLADSDEVRGCVVHRWFSYGYGRSDEPTDACSMDVLKKKFAARGYKIRDLVSALTETDAFLYRRVQ